MISNNYGQPPSINRNVFTNKSSGKNKISDNNCHKSDLQQNNSDVCKQLLNNTNNTNVDLDDCNEHNHHEMQHVSEQHFYYLSCQSCIVVCMIINSLSLLLTIMYVSN